MPFDYAQVEQKKRKLTTAFAWKVKVKSCRN